MIELDLSSKTILITGALGAIAEHMVRRLAEAGARLYLTDARPEHEALAMLEEWNIPPARFVYRQLDVTDLQQSAEGRLRPLPQCAR